MLFLWEWQEFCRVWLSDIIIYLLWRKLDTTGLIYSHSLIRYFLRFRSFVLVSTLPFSLALCIFIALIPYSVQPFRSVLITGFQLELAFQFLTLQWWKFQGASSSFPSSLLLSTLLVWLNMPDTFTSLRQRFAMQCDCVSGSERKNDDAITISHYKAK